MAAGIKYKWSAMMVVFSRRKKRYALELVARAAHEVRCLVKQRKLGRTGLKVSELGFGAWGIGGTSYGPTDDRESVRALNFAFDHGVNFFDTADTYGHGHSEKLVGETFQKSSKRLEAIIATKVGWDFYHGGSKKNMDPQYIRFACGESLKRLKTDYIDLYQLHNPTLEMIENGKMFKVLAELKQAGKIRFWGVSIHLPREGVSVIREGSSDVIQAIYNLIDQRVRGELMPVCQEHDIGLIAREPLYCGLLSGKYTREIQFDKNDHRNRWQPGKLDIDFKKIERLKGALRDTKVSLKRAAIEFVLNQKAVSVVIPGLKTVAQVEEHLQAVEHPKLKPAQIERLESIFQEDELFQMGFHYN
jgi:aryl-alcohol dehydrogenase-like predicted oxidoreductase